MKQLVYFNSIKVQLELPQPLISYKDVPFQFHKGTIRTTIPVYCSRLRSAFQFHKGTIRTFICAARLDSFSDFNSIKVQLELCAHRWACLLVLDFNSIKVQLELFFNPIFFFFFLFQFHKGTIRTVESGAEDKYS